MPIWSPCEIFKPLSMSATAEAFDKCRDAALRRKPGNKGSKHDIRQTTGGALYCVEISIFNTI